MGSDSRLTLPARYPLQLRKHGWNGIICIFICLMDEQLSLRLGLDPYLQRTQLNKVEDSLPHDLQDDSFLEAILDLTDCMSRIRKLIRGCKQSVSTLYNRDITIAWNQIKRGLDRWKRQRVLADNGKLDTVEYLEPAQVLDWGWRPRRLKLVNLLETLGRVPLSCRPSLNDFAYLYKIARFTRIH